MMRAMGGRYAAAAAMLVTAAANAQPQWNDITAPGINQIPLSEVILTNAEMRDLFAIVEQVNELHAEGVRDVACYSYIRRCGNPHDRTTAPFSFYARFSGRSDDILFPSEELPDTFRIVSISWACEGGCPSGIAGADLPFASIEGAGNGARDVFWWPDVNMQAEDVQNMIAAAEADKVLFVAGYNVAKSQYGIYERSPISTGCIGVDDACIWAPMSFNYYDEENHDVVNFGGTSASAPHVAASLASVLAIHPEMTGQDLIRRAKTCAIPTPSLPGGVGRFDLSCLGHAGTPRGTVPYVPGADRSGIHGFIRVVNHSEEDADISITGWDDTGAEFGPVSLSLDALSGVHLTSAHLEEGLESRGLPLGLGDGTGDWRLQFKSDKDTEAFALIRTPDGFMTGMNAVVAPETQGTALYPVTFFNPASNTAKASFLRLVNPHGKETAVTITGIDDVGTLFQESTGSFPRVELIVPANSAVTLTAIDLEQGNPRFRHIGGLGDGTGKWRLIVAADRPLLVMNLLRTNTGSGAYISNLSVRGAKAAPVTPEE